MDDFTSAGLVPMSMDACRRSATFMVAPVMGSTSKYESCFARSALAMLRPERACRWGGKEVRQEQQRKHGGTEVRMATRTDEEQSRKWGFEMYSGRPWEHCPIGCNPDGPVTKYCALLGFRVWLYRDSAASVKRYKSMPLMLVSDSYTKSNDRNIWSTKMGSLSVRLMLEWNWEPSVPRWCHGEGRTNAMHTQHAHTHTHTHNIMKRETTHPE